MLLKAKQHYFKRLARLRAKQARIAPLLKKAHHIVRRGFSIGWCPICEKRTAFYKRGTWLRDQWACFRCESIPRFRAIIYVLEEHFPNWRDLHVHESSPGGASSRKLAKECKHYIPTHYFVDTPLGDKKYGYRCEDLEKQTFLDASFDLVITQDVFEHILDPAAALTEIARTLKPGGSHVFTVPWYYWKDTLIRAVRKDNEVHYLEEPDYHGNPIDPSGSLVVTEWGSDFCDVIYRSSGMTTTAIRIFDSYRGIGGKFIEVFISWKPVLRSSEKQTT